MQNVSQPDSGPEPSEKTAGRRWTIQDMRSWPISLTSHETVFDAYPALRPRKVAKSLFEID